VLYRLKQHGYSAYLVGGCIRDLLLKIKPKDFDIATDARPEKIKKLFRNCLLIGRRFRLAHIRFGREIIEVTTFRADGEKKSFKHRTVAAHGMLLRDNIYGSIEEDAWRRDFTMNALYYNIADFSLVDYCGGLADIQHKIVRIIGDPPIRYQEDPVRLLRAVRFAGKLGFTLAPTTGECIPELAHLLRHVPPARLFEEVLKLFHHGQAFRTYQLLLHYRLLNELFPQTLACFDQESTQKLLEIACKNTDQRIQEDKTVSPAFLFAVFLWPAVQTKVQRSTKRQSSLFITYQHAMSDVLSEQQKQIAIPRRYSTTIREIWDLQQRLSQHRHFMVNRLITHPRFRAAYDFLLLRAEVREISPDITTWWTEFLLADEPTKKQLLEHMAMQDQKKSRRHNKQGKFI
jgi:poly(A) polymerase